MTQQSNLKYYVLSVLLGLLGFIYFELREDSYWWYYTIYIDRFGTSAELNYLKFYWIISIVSLAIGLLTKIESTQNSIWLTGSTVFILFNILTLGTDLIFADMGANEHGDFELYFTESQTGWVYYLVGVGLFLKVIWTNSEIKLINKTFITVSGYFGGGLFYTGLTFIDFIGITHLWLISILVCCSIYILSKRQTFPRKMKKFKTFILALAVLWAFFYTIYSIIKVNEVNVLEDQNSELKEVAKDLAERAEQEAANSLRILYDFRDFSSAIVENPISDYKLFDVIQTADNFKLKRKSDRELKSIPEVILMINAEYKFEPTIERWFGWDTIRLTVKRPYKFDSLEQKIYQAKIVLALTELEKVKSVRILDQEFVRDDFESKLIN